MNLTRERRFCVDAYCDYVSALCCENGRLGMDRFCSYFMSKSAVTGVRSGGRSRGV